MRPRSSGFFCLSPPYRALVDLGPSGLPGPRGRGEMLVWVLGTEITPTAFEAARGRTPGVALAVILPSSEDMQGPGEVLRLIELCRPLTVLPDHAEPNPLDLQALLRSTPDDLAADVMDYIAWRGIVLDHDTRQIVRRTVELSAELRTVSALARSLYLSRRALGRRFLDRGIPVPSHWLHMARVLRACLHLQCNGVSLFDAACELGYPDGFALSNQMHRLFGVRPSVARDHLGWEWLLESWLAREASSGRFAPEFAARFGTVASPYTVGGRASAADRVMSDVASPPTLDR